MSARTEVVLLSFNSGLMSPRMDARVDLQQARHSARTCTNFVVENYGRVSRRAGLRWIAPVKGTVLGGGAGVLTDDDGLPLTDDDNAQLTED
jgi:hypothetical protein